MKTTCIFTLNAEFVSLSHTDIYIQRSCQPYTLSDIYHTASDFKNVFMKFRTFFYILRTIVNVKKTRFASARRGHALIERSMGGLVFSGIGSIRDKANVAMTNLTYNIARTAQVFKYHRNWITA